MKHFFANFFVVQILQCGARKCRKWSFRASILQTFPGEHATGPPPPPLLTLNIFLRYCCDSSIMFWLSCLHLAENYGAKLSWKWVPPPQNRICSAATDTHFMLVSGHSSEQSTVHYRSRPIVSQLENFSDYLNMQRALTKLAIWRVATLDSTHRSQMQPRTQLPTWPCQCHVFPSCNI
jgi:hypothetical protein